jgi:formiminotetrahydrofolate cyclodeaminase
MNFKQDLTRVATNYAFGKKKYTRYGKEMRNTISRIPKITKFQRNRSSKLR